MGVRPEIRNLFWETVILALIISIDMKPKLMVAFIGVFILLGIIGASFILDNGGSDSDEYVGTWYEVYTESGHLQPPYDISISEASLDEKRDPFHIRSVYNNMFAGEFDGVAVYGGILDDSISFEVVDKAQNLFAYVEGNIFDDVIVFNIIKYSDSSFSKVISGDYSKYVREGVSTIPDLQDYFKFPDGYSRNGDGTAYTYDPETGKINAQSFAPFPVKTIVQKRMVAISQTINVDGGDVYSVCILSYIDDDGTVNALMASNSRGMVQTGSITAADGQIRILSDTYFPDSKGMGNFMSYVDVRYDIDYYGGRTTEHMNVSGQWGGTVTTYDGTLVNSGDTFKNLSASGQCFSCKEEVVIDGELEVYTWMGSVFGDQLSIIVLHDGYYSALAGYVDGDNLYLSGYIEVSSGKYVAVHFDLQRFV